MADVVAAAFGTPSSSVPDRPLGALSDAEVIEQVLTWAGRVAAGEARLLSYVGELDEREAWAGFGLLSCAHWMSWRLGMSLKTAHEKVRVARALRRLPVINAAFASGRLSWSQVRAITRVAAPGDEQRFVELARSASGAQLDRLVRGMRRVQRLTEDAAEPERAAHRMRTTVRYDDDGSLVLTVRLPAEQGAVVLAAIEAARDTLDQPTAAADCGQPAPAGDAEPAAEPTGQAPEQPNTPGAPGASMADGLLALATGYLDRLATDRPAAARRAGDQVTIHLDPLSGWARLPDGELLPPPTVTALLTAHDLGRTRREASPALRHLLTTLDGQRCRIPGCSRRRRLHAHHVIFWRDGGPTDLANLILVCSRHHTLVHAGAIHLTLHPDRSLTVTNTDGHLVPHHPAPPTGDPHQIDPGGAITAATLPPTPSTPDSTSTTPSPCSCSRPPDQGGYPPSRGRRRRADGRDHVGRALLGRRAGVGQRAQPVRGPGARIRRARPRSRRRLR